ncbi:MAG: hypothetical protein EOQ39_34845 [Mesorhizobium sp.]|nr:hypothetical protein EOB59_32560 [Mesorhizobium sp. M7A.F.Ca.MR.176.00.0.0]RWA97125.1 MAG: hypothetical protein EOQ37_35275 [Mesorhizobium sp.]RWB08576.1 MAG: hypothetical protein EOQ39_34845 [Mesorhizobium sp.]RWN24574.1 MAG: hypothetical protein EOR95_31985 [Mesorhizobium sp.]RWN32544.1 MAG: hypothetical protein EOR96_29245 [Mesorhizobium sp.]
MEHYVGIDVSLEESSVCIVDATGTIAREVKIASEPEALVRYFDELELSVIRIGLELCSAHGVKRSPCRDRGWSIPLRPLHHEFARSVRDIHWKDRPAKHHDAATHVDRVDDQTSHAPGKQLPASRT